jgi:hypothetical protein
MDQVEIGRGVSRGHHHELWHAVDCRFRGRGFGKDPRARPLNAATDTSGTNVRKFARKLSFPLPAEFHFGSFRDPAIIAPGRLVLGAQEVSRSGSFSRRRSLLCNEDRFWSNSALGTSLNEQPLSRSAAPRASRHPTKSRPEVRRHSSLWPVRNRCCPCHT